MDDLPAIRIPPVTDFEPTRVSEFVASVWCTSCALPSAFASRWVITPVSNPTMIVWRGVFVRCEGCGKHWRDDSIHVNAS